MVEIESCGNLVNASSALLIRGIEEEVKGECSVNEVLAQVSADLQSERQKNAKLTHRISMLEEAQLQNRSWLSARERSFKKFKRQKMGPIGKKIENGDIKMASNTNIMPAEDANLRNRLVNWMSMDDNQFFNFEKVKDGESTVDWDDTDDSDDENLDEKHNRIGQKERENGDNVQAPNEIKYLLLGEDQVKDSSSRDINSVYYTGVLKRRDWKETDTSGEYNVSPKIFTSRQELRGFGSLSMQKKNPKIAFSPKEVKRIIELEELLLKNAQSHTIRKIIVFASLGIRHGCEDMYELDFSHFSILQKGEPYVSPKNPGEHVLYEKPGVRRKIFYPNRQNPSLCPVQILEVEKAMRPPDASCPSCLFLCIKYGGRTRNLPQNEYVRQRMGRNKLKSFGPVICRMAMLVHIRSGSFFFKAFGITLLFMAGFPDDLVRKETKYRNLDLLQKYYRTDADAEGEELFLSRPTAFDARPIPNSQQLTGKTIVTKSKAKKHTGSISKSHNTHKASILQSPPSSSETPTTQFGLVGYTSIQTHAMTGFQSMLSQIASESPLISNPLIGSNGPTIPSCNQSSYPIMQSQQTNSFVPMMYFPTPNGFPPCPYPAFSYFPSAGNYIPIHPQPYYSHTLFNPLIPNMVQGTGKNSAVSDESDSDSNSSSSDTEAKEE
ncbi:hypothetical protein LguiA_025378 [Lonicera macranthoides]